MPPDLDTLRLRALAVPGVARLADHHDGLGRHPRPTPCALRVFDDHVEIDISLVAGHAVTGTTTALRAALAPLLAGRAVHISVIDVDTAGALPDGPDTCPADRTRLVARAVMAELESLAAEGLAVGDVDEVTAVCRLLDAFDVDPVSRRVLVRQLRGLLAAARGPVCRSLLGRLDDLDGAP